MKCPNCQLPFVEEKDGKYFCSTCGWLEKVGKEWQSCDAPKSEPGSQNLTSDLSGSQTKEPESPQEPVTPPEPDPARLEPDPAALEPDPSALEPDPSCVKSYLGGLVTITEVDE